MTTTSKPLNTENTLLHCLPATLVSDYMIRGKFTSKSYNKNQIIHFEAEACTFVSIILSGEIAVERIGEKGDLMTVNRFTRGDLIGANLIFSSTAVYPMTVVAKKSSKVLIIEKDTLIGLLHDYPEFMMGYLGLISDLTVLIGTKMKNRVSRTIRDSILIFINKQYVLQNSYTIALNISKKAIAEMFGISRTSLSRELQKMKADNLIDYDNKTITILDKSILN